MKRLICLVLGHKHIPKYWDFYFQFEHVKDADKKLQIAHRTCIRCSKLITYVNPKFGDETHTSISIKGEVKI